MLSVLVYLSQFRFEQHHIASSTSSLIMSDDSTVNTSTIKTTEPPVRTPQRRHSSFDEQTIRSLDKQLAHRPEKTELVDRNILKDDRVAPALQAAREQLEKSQLQDKLGQALLHRPKPEELVKEGILQPEEIPPSA